MKTSIEVVKARTTKASMVITLPMLMGCENEILSTEAVTTTLLLCRCAETAAAMSIQCINLPPKRLLRLLVSLGRINSVMVTLDSLQGFFIFFYHPSLPSKGTKLKWLNSFFEALFCDNFFMAIIFCCF